MVQGDVSEARRRRVNQLSESREEVNSMNDAFQCDAQRFKIRWALSQQKMYTPVCSRKKLSLADPTDDVGGLSQRKMNDASEGSA